MTDEQERDMRAWQARQEGEQALRSAVERARGALERAGADAPIGDVVALVREAAGELRNALERHNGASPREAPPAHDDAGRQMHDALGFPRRGPAP